jgi:Putative prokaryotic signal transducing protein
VRHHKSPSIVGLAFAENDRTDYRASAAEPGLVGYLFELPLCYNAGMNDRPEHISLLTSTPLELQAGIIVGALEENGIKATMAGQATAGFRAEAPGWVQVLVAEEDLEPAKAVLEQLRRESREIDWSQIDVGEPDDE